MTLYIEMASDSASYLSEIEAGFEVEITKQSDSYKKTKQNV